MEPVDIPDVIKERISHGRYQFKLHALQRINERGILPSEVRDALLACSVVEDYPDDKRGHSCLVWGKAARGRDLHMVCGLTDEIVWVVTIYEPKPDTWETPLRRRAKG
jgi:hypothetical protein